MLQYLRRLRDGDYISADRRNSGRARRSLVARGFRRRRCRTSCRPSGATGETRRDEKRVDEWRPTDVARSVRRHVTHIPIPDTTTCYLAATDRPLPQSADNSGNRKHASAVAEELRVARHNDDTMQYDTIRYIDVLSKADEMASIG